MEDNALSLEGAYHVVRSAWEDEKSPYELKAGAAPSAVDSIARFLANGLRTQELEDLDDAIHPWKPPAGWGDFDGHILSVACLCCVRALAAAGAGVPTEVATEIVQGL